MSSGACCVQQFLVFLLTILKFVILPKSFALYFVLLEKLTVPSLTCCRQHYHIGLWRLSHRDIVKKGKRGACRQKAATVLPDRTAATYCIYSSLSSFEFDIVGYGAPHDA